MFESGSGKCLGRCAPRPGQAGSRSDRLIPSLKAQTSAFGGGLTRANFTFFLASGMEILYEEEYGSRNTINCINSKKWFMTVF